MYVYNILYVLISWLSVNIRDVTHTEVKDRYVPQVLGSQFGTIVLLWKVAQRRWRPTNLDLCLLYTQILIAKGIVMLSVSRDDVITQFRHYENWLQSLQSSRGLDTPSSNPQGLF